MPTATPNTLLDTLVGVVTAAADEAANQAAALQGVLDQALAAAQEVAELPAALLDQLEQATHPPDWFSLLVFVLLELSKLDPHLSVGAITPDNNWSRAVMLTYRVDQTPDAPSASVALALTDPNTTHGVILRIAGLDHVSFGAGPVIVTIDGHGTGEWRIPFSGGIQAPAAAAGMTVTVAYGPVRPIDPGAPADIGIGSARVTAALSSDAPLWHVEAGIGDEAAVPGVEARVDLSSTLGALADIVHIQAIDEKYSPKVSAGAGIEPAYSLGHGS